MREICFNPGVGISWTMERILNHEHKALSQGEVEKKSLYLRALNVREISNLSARFFAFPAASAAHFPSPRVLKVVPEATKPVEADVKDM